MKSSLKNKRNNSAAKSTARKPLSKDKQIDLTPKNEVKEMFINWFKKNNNIGQIMTKQDVVQNILTKLNAKQDDALEEAMNELKKDGLFEIKEDGVTLVLTKIC
ncbi:MAG: hypothetical protein A2513_11155 [Sulfurimonas sp. RIFOXYD12_FULL_33_39]|uniref:hypothetical protein n=1 Tax=unclassified Sulfurimonas TaxID=2623549 RepID=UPI0008B1D6BE|nr:MULTISPECIES: hypothetical protein [unclassified Sulfurimonas]OHE05381.1 MAG: hypothetical protein A3G74_07970 [Sulfurimonas sp. RIFCSPLOWO2_12_FULL_34_6]OHE09855.1 MAG: hypothetical protein A2513_11155 [Sulfurimonas sp. RIFOXYD12_FULL_33_39]OHE13637.1 MAG: hypothetical protein A2530_08600 [Sulfurimonas sp. RIFOXYD2_FULL_34_21]DAB27366.1 MAG TPA: hypothetical protein CFH78_08275 [Sulfurimonas sp. UBA10385]